MSSLNRVQLIGRLGRDPEGRALANGSRVVNLSVATSETWKDKGSGEKRERTEWHRVVLFNERLGKFAEGYARKGALVYVEGQLQTRKYQDTTSGNDRYTTEIVAQQFNGEFKILSDPKGEREPGTNSDVGTPELDDSIPF